MKAFIVAVLPITIYVGASVYHLALGNAHGFTRLGSLAVFMALTVVGYALQRAKRRDAKLEVAELEASSFFLAAAGTLQWGYGDFFHCWINGNGWTACG